MTWPLNRFTVVELLGGAFAVRELAGPKLVLLTPSDSGGTWKLVLLDVGELFVEGAFRKLTLASAPAPHTVSISSVTSLRTPSVDPIHAS